MNRLIFCVMGQSIELWQQAETMHFSVFPPPTQRGIIPRISSRADCPDNSNYANNSAIICPVLLSG
jgi:hypothetical protein